MKKNILLLLITFSFAVYCDAQVAKSNDVIVTWGDNIKGTENSRICNLYVNSKGNLISLRAWKSKFTVLQYGHSNLAVAKTASFDFKPLEKKTGHNIYSDDCVFFNDKVCVFIMEKDSEKEKFYFKVATIDTKTMLVRDVVQISEMKFLGNNSLEKLIISVSPDQSKLAIAHFQKGKNKDDLNLLIKTFDRNFRELMSRQLDDVGSHFIYGDRAVRYLGGQVNQFTLTNYWYKWGNSYIDGAGDFSYAGKASVNKISLKKIEKTSEMLLVDNTGKVFFPVLTETEGDLKRRNGEVLQNKRFFNSFDFHMFSPDQENYEVKKVKLSDKVIDLQDYKFQLAKNGDIIGGGFFCNELTKGINGTWFLRIDANSLEIKQNTADVYDLKFITQFLSESKQQKVMKRYNNKKHVTLSSRFTVDDFIETDDGEVRMVAEIYNIKTKTGSTRAATTEYIYGDILVMNHDGRGDVTWKTTIRKLHKSVNDFGYWNSYGVIAADDKLYFMYTDNEDNFTETKPDKVHNSNGKKGTFVYVTVDTHGKQKKERLYVIKDVATFTLPHFAAIKESDLYLYAEKGNVYNVVKFSCE
ncbi:MAG: hypothetical protein COA57_11580 [Flavobacteriales bacterium]|nr:MAG: hypothetical protein COA57_11580 [Flavobacteriales bacterium]